MTRYPGQETEFYIVKNNVVTGPLTGLEKLVEYKVEPDTPVWYQGLDDWKPAVMAPLTRQLFEPGSEFNKARLMAAPDDTPEINEQPEVVTAERMEPYAEPDAEQPAVRYVTSHEDATRNEPVAETVAQPRSYLVWAIVVAVIFNLICGVIAIIYAVKVKAKYRVGNIEGSRRCSESAQWWIAGGICLGLILMVFRFFVSSEQSWFLF